MLVLLNVEILPTYRVIYKKTCCVQDIQNLSAKCKGVGMFQRQHDEINHPGINLKKTVKEWLVRLFVRDSHVDLLLIFK